MKITVPFPEIIRENEKYLFSDRRTYSVSQLKINKHKNVFVTHEGLCLKNLRLLPKSHFNISGNSDFTFYFEFWKLALEQYLVSTYGKSLSKIQLSEKNYLLVHTKWFGYFFWLTDILPKLIKTKYLHEDVELIYPDGWDAFPFVTNSLKLFPMLNIKRIPAGVHLQVGKLILPQTRQWSNAIDPIEINLVRDFLFEKLEENKIVKNYGSHIFISRKKASRRKITNNDEVESLLFNYGFQSVCLEDYSFLEQVSIMKHAKQVLGLHGAGLANAIFMEKGGALIELSPTITNKKDFRIPFWRLANAIESQYYILFCETDNKESNIYDNNLTIHLSNLIRCLNNLNK
jgi:capsular polysaccharide biosynthesis protein